MFTLQFSFFSNCVALHCVVLICSGRGGCKELLSYPYTSSKSMAFISIRMALNDCGLSSDWV